MKLARHLSTEDIGDAAETAVIDALVKAIPWVEEWDGYDFDKTLAFYEKSDVPFSVLSLGDPIPEMVNHLKENMASGKKCKIFTARVSYDDERINDAVRKVMRQWTIAVFGVELEVTCKKDIAMRRLFDDRAFNVIPNKGIVVSPVDDEAKRQATADFHRDLKKDLGQDQPAETTEQK